jgi:hypothetical protein
MILAVSSFASIAEYDNANLYHLTLGDSVVAANGLVYAFLHKHGPIQASAPRALHMCQQSAIEQCRSTITTNYFL